MTAAVAIPLAALGAAVLAERGAVVSMLVARRTGFLDRPTGYKAHGSATPYLGGAAVLVAFLVATISVEGVASRLVAILACAAILAFVGTADDRVNVPPQWRVLAEMAAGAILWSGHLGFTTFASSALNLGLTMLWVVSIVNAFNLLDNIDGACAVAAAVSAAGVGAAALAHGDTRLAVMAIAMTGACLGFLRHNLAGPARIFLGDGGSMLLGFLVASLAMALVRKHGVGASELFAAVMFAGLPVLDTTLVVISRLRRRVYVLTGGRDHLTHRLLPRLGTPRRVALTLGAVQAVVVTLAAFADQIGAGALFALGGVVAVFAMLALWVLESPTWAPTAPAAVVPAADASAGVRYENPSVGSSGVFPGEAEGDRYRSHQDGSGPAQAPPVPMKK